LLSLTFAEAGYAVKAAASGDDAIAQCAAEPFDLVLSDVVMPKMDGHQLAQWIARRAVGSVASASQAGPGWRNRYWFWA
jgi:CheY-like chemotaxis protein